MLEPAFLAQWLLQDEVQILAVERFIHGAYVFLPAINILFFHHVLGITRPALTRATLVISLLLALTVPTPWYFTGLNHFAWGSIARGGPAFQVFGLYSFVAAIYFVLIFLRGIRRESQPQKRLQRIYILISFGIMAVLTLLNVPAINGIDLYPAGNFVFIPLAVLAFGVRRHRLLEFDAAGRLGAAWLIPLSFFALPNYLLFALVRPYFSQFVPLMQFGLLLFWFLANLLLLRLTEPVIVRAFYPARTFLDERRLRFMDRMTQLRDLQDLQIAITDEVRETLGYRTIEFALSEKEGLFSVTGTGARSELRVEQYEELTRSTLILERDVPEEWPPGKEIQEELDRLFREVRAEVMISFSREDQLLALMFLSERGKDKALSVEEYGYLRAVVAGGSIALSNSIMFQNIANFKDRLEIQTRKLQHEIIEREEAQKALQQSERQYRLLAENMKDIIWTLDLATLHISYISPSVEQILGFTPEEQMKRELNQILTPESWERVVRILAEELEKEKGEGANPNRSVNIEIEQLCKNGSFLWTEVTAAFLRDEVGQPVQVLGVSRDITERRRRQEAQEATQAAEKANRAKSEFLANMSHELRTPLNHILGFTELVADQHFGPLNPIQTEYLQDVLTSSQHLLELINDILDLSKVEAGKMTIELEEIPLGPLLESSLSMFKEKSLKQHLTLDLDSERAPARVRVDPRKFKQVLYNLLANAVKFTPEGGAIHLEVEEIPDDGSGGQGRGLQVSVRDTGIGIKAADLERIFNSFEQADCSASRSYDGTGLGLALSRRLVELHDGRIWAESRGEGQGSRFVMVWPQ
jgi:PAS domain S-box-containing protein